MARMHVTNEDQGKRVLNANGHMVGVVTEVKNRTAYVNPDPDITDRIQSKLGWGDRDEGDFMLEEDHVDEVTDDAIHLKV